jgi:hypothetical protein
MRRAWLLLFTSACAWIDDKELADRIDGDGDGEPALAYGGEDCDDSNVNVRPGADELCNERDDNCDGAIDEGAGTQWFPDADFDGYGADGEGVTACSQPEGMVPVAGDCDDADRASNPGGEELICDGLDQDCDGLEDDAEGYPWYADDVDQDGYGDPNTVVMACEAPENYVDNDDDCDPTTDGGLPQVYYRDADGDGFGGTETTSACEQPEGYAEANTDCDDDAPDAYPGAFEICGDDIDQDCDSEDRGCRYEDDPAIDDALAVYKPSAGSNSYAGSFSAFGELDGAAGLDVVISAPSATSATSGAYPDAGTVWVSFGAPTAANTTLDGAGDLQISGASATHQLGSAIAVFDMDGDGANDLILGGNKHGSNNTGRVDLFLGPLSTGTLDLNVVSADATLYGATNTYSGTALAALAHADGDAILIVGGPALTSPSVVTELWLLRGLDGDEFAEEATITGLANDLLGRSVVDLGDVDGDGFSEVGFGAHKHVDTGSTGEGTVGAVWVLSAIELPDGSDTDLTDYDTNKVSGLTASASFGFSVNPAGDLNGDGLADVAVAEPGHVPDDHTDKLGRVWLFEGPWHAGTASTHSVATFIGSTANGNFGYDLASIGDVDRDGKGDLAIGEPVAAGNKGAVHLLYGRFAGTFDLSIEDVPSVYGETAGDNIGNSVSTGADITGDGIDDMLLGATGVDSRGAAYLFPIEPE